MEPLSGGTIDSLIWAVRAMWAETVGFRFAYPLEIDDAAGPKDSLHYYIYSDSLAWDVLRLDSEGIAQCCYPTTGAVYRPGFVAWYGLVHLGHYLRRGDQIDLQIFLKQVNWLEREAVLRDDGALVWPHKFDWRDGATFLKAPWLSANAHGLAVSALVRGWRLTRRPSLLELLKKSWSVFEISVGHNGLGEVVNGHVLYTELRGGAILDHFLTALLGLYDLFAEIGDPAVGRLFSKGIESLKAMLCAWDYRRKWSWYYSHAYLCPPAYHCLNRVLLKVLAQLSREPILAYYSDSWNPDRLSSASRLEVFFRFLLTKNASRLRDRTWRQKRIKATPFAGS
jgi:D-glucuronyl C5-epimerase-like protein